jgi:hypothetical protein
MYKLLVEVPETIMMGESADISFVCEFEWYSCAYYNECNVQFPKENVFIGRYLGTAEPKVGSVIKAKYSSIMEK